MYRAMYRTVDSDDEGDPIDFGVVQASDKGCARAFLEGRFRDLGLSPNLDVYLYAITDMGDGFWETAERQAITI